MTDTEFTALIREALQVQYLIVKAGGMATKSRVEDALMTRHSIDRSLAHDVTNTVESRNLRAWDTCFGFRWAGIGPEPQAGDWPEIVINSKKGN